MNHPRPDTDDQNADADADAATTETSYSVDAHDQSAQHQDQRRHLPRRTPPEYFERPASRETFEPARPRPDDSVADAQEPDQDEQLRASLAPRGTARSTRVLALLMGAVVIFGLGALLGRATAPAGGATSAPPAVGVIEGVDLVGGFPVLTVRTAEGTVTTVRTSAGTTVAVPRAGGPASLGRGQEVTVTSERGADGALTATRVDIPG